MGSLNTDPLYSPREVRRADLTQNSLLNYVQTRAIKTLKSFPALHTSQPAWHELINFPPLLPFFIFILLWNWFYVRFWERTWNRVASGSTFTNPFYIYMFISFWKMCVHIWCTDEHKGLHTARKRRQTLHSCQQDIYFVYWVFSLNHNFPLNNERVSIAEIDFA